MLFSESVAGELARCRAFPGKKMLRQSNISLYCTSEIAKLSTFGWHSGLWMRDAARCCDIMLRDARERGSVGSQLRLPQGKLSDSTCQADSLQSAVSTMYSALTVLLQDWHELLPSLPIMAHPANPVKA